MITIYLGSTLPSQIRQSLLRYRYDVFVRQLGWQLPLARDGQELDEFDGPRAVYVVDCDEQERVCGCARLLPTVEPYLLSEHFLDLLDEPAPCSSEVWELSRLSVASTTAGAAKPDALHGLLAAVLAFAYSRGIKSLIGVTFPSLTQRLSELGARVALCGATRRDDEGRAIVACEMPITDSLAGLQAKATLQSMRLDAQAQMPCERSLMGMPRHQVAFGKHIAGHQHGVGRGRQAGIQPRL